MERDETCQWTCLFNRGHMAVDWIWAIVIVGDAGGLSHYGISLAAGKGLLFLIFFSSKATTPKASREIINHENIQYHSFMLNSHRPS
jgi:hypothetical protein